MTTHAVRPQAGVAGVQSPARTRPRSPSSIFEGTGRFGRSWHPTLRQSEPYSRISRTSRIQRTHAFAIAQRRRPAAPRSRVHPTWSVSQPDLGTTAFVLVVPPARRSQRRRSASPRRAVLAAFEQAVRSRGHRHQLCLPRRAGACGCGGDVIARTTLESPRRLRSGRQDPRTRPAERQRDRLGDEHPLSRQEESPTLSETAEQPNGAARPLGTPAASESPKAQKITQYCRRVLAEAARAAIHSASPNRLRPCKPGAEGGGDGERAHGAASPALETSSPSTSSTSGSATGMSEGCRPLTANAYSRNGSSRVTLRTASVGFVKGVFEPDRSAQLTAGCMNEVGDGKAGARIVVAFAGRPDERDRVRRYAWQAVRRCRGTPCRPPRRTPLVPPSCLRQARRGSIGGGWTRWRRVSLRSGRVSRWKSRSPSPARRWGAWRVARRRTSSARCLMRAPRRRAGPARRWIGARRSCCAFTIWCSLARTRCST